MLLLTAMAAFAVSDAAAKHLALAFSLARFRCVALLAIVLPISMHSPALLEKRAVLIFVSVAERHAEIVADTAIHDRVPKGTWESIVARLTMAFANRQPVEGFVVAIDEVGNHLATHFPPGSCDANELPDHLIVLDGI